MSDTNQPYSEAQKAMIEKFNAHIREGSSSFAAPTGLAGVKTPKRIRHKFMEYRADCGMIYSAVGMKCCHIAYHENHEGVFLVCGRQLTQWRGDDGKPLCKTCKRAARKPANGKSCESAVEKSTN